MKYVSDSSSSMLSAYFTPFDYLIWYDLEICALHYISQATIVASFLYGLEPCIYFNIQVTYKAENSLDWRMLFLQSYKAIYWNLMLFPSRSFVKKYGSFSFKIIYFIYWREYMKSYTVKQTIFLIPVLILFTYYWK